MSDQHPTTGHRNALLALEETRRELTFWSPKWLRARTKLDNADAHLRGLEASHPEWIRPDHHDLATHYCVALGIVCAVLLDTFLISAVAEFAASVFFPNSATVVAIARLCIPALLVGFEVMVGILTISAKEWPTWRGMLPEYQLFSRIGWLLVAVTPMMVVASLLAGGMLNQTGMILLAIAQAILGAALHSVIVKGGRWIREAVAYFRFRLNILMARRSVTRAQDQADEATNAIETAFPVFENSYRVLRRALPERTADIGMLPLDVMHVVDALFGKGRSDYFRSDDGGDDAASATIPE